MGGVNQGNEEALVGEIESLSARNQQLEELRMFVVGKFGTDDPEEIAAGESSRLSMQMFTFMCALVESYESAKKRGTTECFEVFVRENLQRLAKDQEFPFSVVAGKWDGERGNCKVADSLHTLDEAIASCDKVSDYPWSYILYKGRVLELWGKDCWPSAIEAMQGGRA